MGLGKLGLLILLPTVLGCIIHADAQAPNRISKVFNVVDFGAVANPAIDNAPAFLKAWEAACQWGKGVRFLVPRGTFVVGPATFTGPCKGSLTFQLEGVIKAHQGIDGTDKWIAFRYLDRFIVKGNGVIDGSADIDWFTQHCGANSTCDRTVPVNVRFDFLTNSRIHHITSLNSKSTHMNLFGCSNVNISKVRIQAPGNSPNTDGIRIGQSIRVNISLVTIRTGDDCISILDGTRNLGISDVFCGPGHGISIGSLGRYQNEEDVTGVTVQRCTFAGTTNGVRIKSWAKSYSTNTASNFLFEDIHMDRVANPIIIDQQYCPSSPCYLQESKQQVQIENIKYKNIWGTSTTEATVNLKCSKTKPCRGLTLENINLSYNGVGSASSVCTNAEGVAYGHQNPRPCV